MVGEFPGLRHARPAGQPARDERLPRDVLRLLEQWLGVDAAQVIPGAGSLARPVLVRMRRAAARRKFLVAVCLAPLLAVAGAAPASAAAPPRVAIAAGDVTVREAARTARVTVTASRRAPVALRLGYPDARGQRAGGQRLPGAVGCRDHRPRAAHGDGRRAGDGRCGARVHRGVLRRDRGGGHDDPPAPCAAARRRPAVRRPDGPGARDRRRPASRVAAAVPRRRSLHLRHPLRRRRLRYPPPPRWA